MPCTCLIPHMTTGPFHVCRGEEVCVVCGSHKDNEFFACHICLPHKPKVVKHWKDGRRY